MSNRWVWSQNALDIFIYYVCGRSHVCHIAKPMQLGSSRHPRALRVRSTIQLTSIVTKGMTKSSEIDVVIKNGDDEMSLWLCVR